MQEGEKKMSATRLCYRVGKSGLLRPAFYRKFLRLARRDTIVQDYRPVCVSQTRSIAEETMYLKETLTLSGPHDPGLLDGQ